MSISHCAPAAQVAKEAPRRSVPLLAAVGAVRAPPMQLLQVAVAVAVEVLLRLLLAPPAALPAVVLGGEEALLISFGSTHNSKCWCAFGLPVRSFSQPFHHSGKSRSRTQPRLSRS